MLQIEWKSSHYHSNGQRRSRPKASTIHGWLVKWRATFSGNERLRKEGIREMREAKAAREQKQRKKIARRAKAGPSQSCFRLWPNSPGKKEQQSQAPRGPSRPCPSKHLSRTKHSASYTTHSPKGLNPDRSRRRPTQLRKTVADSPSPRKASHNSRTDTN